MNTGLGYRCPAMDCDRRVLTAEPSGLRCTAGHFYPYLANTTIPVFSAQTDSSSEYAQENAAELHDNALKWVLRTFGSDETSLRKALVARLELSKGKRVLITGAGAGNDLPYISEALCGEGVIYAQDIAPEMLLEIGRAHV